ncbi:dTDP-D-glucose 4,6-dehydratase [Legionella wadsworthii]|uniref:dTDP-D-glucose 4,6-dehydratase n=1 Tax=Legionella wadsworthii TaxID=28088 RepID=A0A378LSA6_9GAMM|nr:NAD-dependent epimerase/dehydratase family protein [Legionella wadsworthii]STY29836.1 dTDP-D-glucose 4,6-dehydratase [Legionella wadsworthii]
MNKLMKDKQHTLITGGAGFIGTNLADRLLSQGKKVMIYDNLSRNGVEKNLQWLVDKYDNQLFIQISDIKEKGILQECVNNADQIFHFSGQVAVTSSLINPVQDFEVNLAGTFNVLEAIRRSSNKPPLLFTSSNKVYGDLTNIRLIENATRYYPENEEINLNGVDESCPLNFHSPYGCSKGSADQYVLDYARSFGLKAIVFRMSCIYGPHQFGTEDQGWVAHFAISALENRPIVIYGDGKQVRDILFVEDLIDAFILAQKNIHKISGNAFNIGGGPRNTVSLTEIIKLIQEQTGKPLNLAFEEWRIGDQQYYVSNINKFKNATGWNPKFSVSEGVDRLISWLSDSRNISLEKNKIVSKAMVE